MSYLQGFCLVIFCVLPVGCDSPLPADAEPLPSAGPSQSAGTQRMVQRLARIANTSDPMQNSFMNQARVDLLRQTLSSENVQDEVAGRFQLANELLRAGESEAAVAQLQTLLELVQQQPAEFPSDLPHKLRSLLAISLLRIGEQANCVALHMSKSCLFPIDREGMYRFQFGARAAMQELTLLLNSKPDDLVSRWLLNLAAMAVGDYPQGVPENWLIPAATFASDYPLAAFTNRAAAAGLATLGLAGGSIVEDFDGDGYLDVMASSWGLQDQLRLYRNQRDGTFRDITRKAGLQGIVGGLNLIQGDYDNDGHIDVFVLRGAWLIRSGQHPNSLLRNNGKGGFEDVTEAAGLLSFHPTQAAAWGDFDNDGWLDLFIGNEARPNTPHPSELYRNNADGTFTNIAATAGVSSGGFVKGATWGDFDNDGWQDLYVSRMSNSNLLFRNEGATGQAVFREIALAAGVRSPLHSFATWFWDYDNDGWLDIFAADFPPNAFASDEVASFSEAQLYQVVADYLALRPPSTSPRLYRNNRDGTFVDMTERAGLVHPLLAMGANFGDVDNDGYPDFYIGTGAPDLRTLLPNRLFRNVQGQYFQDVTTSGGVGHLQKGHAISFADIDNDGDQDIYAVMGGAYAGDVYQNALFVNPGHGNHWLNLRLEGVDVNRSAIGARIRIDLTTPHGSRQVFATVSSGGSFGASSLQQEIGLGKATAIDAVEIFWPGGQRQVFREVPLDQTVYLREHAPAAVVVKLAPVPWPTAVQALQSEQDR